MSDIYVPVKNVRRPLKLYVKRNNKLILNPSVITQLKKDFRKVKLPTKFAWDKQNKKIINLYSGDSNNTSKEFKKLTVKDRKQLQFYGDTIYDRNNNKLVNKKKIYKKDGTLRKKYENIKILKSGQSTTTKTTVKDKFFSFTYTHNVKYKNYTTKKGESKIGRTEQRTKQFNFKGKSNWTKAQILAQENELIDDYEEEIGADSPIANSTDGSSSGSSGSSGSGGGGYSFALNADMFLSMDGDERQSWNKHDNRCVYDYIIYRYGDIKGCKKICNEKTLYYIFNNPDIIGNITVEDNNRIEDYFNKHFLTEKQFNKRVYDIEIDAYSNFLSHDINGTVWGAGELLEMFLVNEPDESYRVVKTYKDFLKIFWGVSPKQINHFCKYLRIPHYCLDNQDKVIHYYYPTERNTTNKIPAMVYKSSGGHIHPITDPKKIKSLGQLCSDLTTQQKQKMKENIVGEVELGIVEIFNCKDRIAYLINIMKENKTQVLNNKIKISGDDITCFTLDDVKYIFVDTDEKDPINYAKIYCELNKIDYVGQSLTGIAMGMLKENITINSECNHIVNNILHTDKLKFRTHLGFTDKNNINDIDDDCKAYDISKCYSKCITEPTEEFITLNYNSLPQEYNGEDITAGLYYIKTDDNTLYHGANIYSNSIVKYGLLNNIITKDNILWWIPASKTHSKDLFKPLFNEYKKNSMGNMDLNKRLNNFTTGLVGISKFKKTKISCSTNVNDAFNYILEYQNDNCYLRQHEGISVYGNKVKRDLDIHNIPIYIQLLDDSNIRLHKLGMEATNNKIQNVLYRKTDCVVVRNADPTLKLGEEWGEYRQEDLPTNYYNCNYKERIPNIITPQFKFKYNYVDITDSTDYKEIHQTLRVNKGLMINGSAGTGKSHVIKKISEEIGDDECARLCFTNKGAININGQTIHKFLGLDIEGKILKANIKKIKKKIKVIIIDEVSMVSSFLWARLYDLYKETQIPFLLVGDWKQIPPVEDMDDFDYLYHPAVVELSGGKICELIKVYRYCDKLKRASNDVMGLDTKDFGNQITKNNICFTNRTRKFVNDLVVNEIVRTQKPETFLVNALENKRHGNESSEDFKIRCKKNQSQTIKLFNGMPIIASKTKEQGAICVNNEEFKITSINKEKFTAESIRPDGVHKVELETKFFYCLFLPAYCITTHKAQGSTIKGNMTLWDWDIMDKRLRYTAITRATGIDKINFCSQY